MKKNKKVGDQIENFFKIICITGQIWSFSFIGNGVTGRNLQHDHKIFPSQILIGTNVKNKIKFGKKK